MVTGQIAIVMQMSMQIRWSLRRQSHLGVCRRHCSPSTRPKRMGWQRTCSWERRVPASSQQSLRRMCMRAPQTAQLGLCSSREISWHLALHIKSRHSSSLQRTQTGQQPRSLRHLCLSSLSWQTAQKRGLPETRWQSSRCLSSTLGESQGASQRLVGLHLETNTWLLRNLLSMTRQGQQSSPACQLHRLCHW